MVKNKVLLLNDILIYTIGIFIIYAIMRIVIIYDSFYTIAFGGIYASVIVFYLIHYGYLLICKIFNKRVRLQYNFFIACLLMAVVALLYFFYFVWAYTVFSIALSTSGSGYNSLIRNILIYFILFIFGAIFYIYSNISFSKKRHEYYKVAIAFNILYSFISVLYLYFMVSIIGSLNIPLIITLLSPVVIVSLIFNCHYIMTLFNISTEKDFFTPKENLKVFVTGLFKKDSGYLIGIFFIILIGVAYLIGSGNDTYLKYVGYYFLLMSLFRIIDYIWMKLIKDKNKRIRYLNQYIMMLVNAVFILLAVYLIYKVLTSVNIDENEEFSLITAILIIIIIARSVVVVFNFYHSRINVTKEPYFITLNNLAIISLIVSIYAFIISFMLIVGVGKLDLKNTINVFSHVIVGLIIFIVTIMVIRAIIGIVKLNKIEEKIS